MGGIKSVPGYDLQENMVIWSTRLFFTKVASRQECGRKCDGHQAKDSDWSTKVSNNFGLNDGMNSNKCVAFRFHKGFKCSVRI